MSTREGAAEFARTGRRLVPLSWLAVLASTILVLFAPLPIAAAGAAAYIIASVRSPLPGLCLIVISLPFYLLGRPIGHLTFSPTEILILLSCLAWLIRTIGYGITLLGRAVPRSAAPAAHGSPSDPDAHGPRASATTRTLWIHCLRSWLGDPLVAALVGLTVIAGLISLTASIALHESLRSFRTIILEPAAFYVLAVTGARRRRDGLVLALALVTAGVLISLVGLWQYVADQNIITAEAGLRRIRGFYGSPNNLGLFLGRAIPLAVSLALWWRAGRPILAAAGVIMLAALILTFSAGAWIAVLVSLLVVAWLRGPRIRRFAVAIAAGVILIGTVAATRVPRLGSHLDVNAGTSLERLLVWQSALHMLRDHPLRGIGLDNFLYYYRHGYRLPAAWREPDLSHPHNLILDFWLSLGLPGPILLALLLGRFAALIASAWRRASTLDRGIYAGALGAVIDTVVHGMIDNSFFLVDLSVLFWLLFAIVTVRERDQGRAGSLAASQTRDRGQMVSESGGQRASGP
ncbi:MAG: O-antigen ligase family protein [Chloroflexi bacterium]|nr:O-antigen ligase family protein [Chloroflexota bacterium]